MSSPDNKEDKSIQKQEDPSQSTQKYVCCVRASVLFWSIMIVAALILGIIYFIVKTGKSHCPWGTALPGDVTAPDDPNFGEVLAIIWSFLPYAMGLICVVDLFRRRTIWPLTLLLMAAMIVVVNEGFFKRVISQDRPSKSCLE